MKKIKIVVMMLMMLIVTACSSKDFKLAYDNMQISENGITGYLLNLKVSGTYDNKSINKEIRISNYNDSDYEIRITNNTRNGRKESEETAYIKDGKIYEEDENRVYVEVDEQIKYSNPSIYLEGLNNVKKSSKAKEQKIGNKNYQVYEVQFKKEFVEELLEKSELEKIKITKKVSGKIYLNEDNRVYQMIYEINDLRIKANYYGINTAKEVVIPLNK